MIGTLRAVAFDAPDHHALADFYAKLLDAELLGDSDEWAVIRTPGGWRLGFQPAPGLIRSTWPTQQLPQQLHLDLQVADMSEAARRALSLGAARAYGEDGDDDRQFIVMTDPAGHPFCLCASEQDEPIRVFGVCIDCPAPAVLARFYGVLLGLESRYEGADGGWLAGDGPMASLTFQAVPDYNPPRWPDPGYPQQLHLDVAVRDADAAEREVLEIGGRRLPGGGDNWRVYADPADHPFCLVVPEA
jgi:Glyoxalase-like domain